MSYVNLYDCVGDVLNKSRCINELRKNAMELASEDGADYEIARKLNSLYRLSLSRYFTSGFREVSEGDPHSYYLWLDTGCTNIVGDVLYAQFGKSAFGWTGCYIGTEDEISFHQIGKTLRSIAEETEDNTKSVCEVVSPSDTDLKVFKPEYDSIDDEYDVVGLESAIKGTFFDDLFERLLIQKEWGNSNYSLKNYIVLLVNRLNSMIKSNKDVSKYLMWNEAGDKGLINSALLDKFGKDILFVADAHRKNKLSFTELQLVDSKVMLCDCGFDRSALAVELECVPFYNNSVSELVFDASLGDFDLENWYRLSHCIIDRRGRFPEPWCNGSAEQLCQDVVNAIEVGIRLSKYDSGYIKPFYARKKDKIQFIIPYHVGNNFQGKPELGIVVDKTEYDLWQVMTILEYNSVLTNIKALSLYSDSSF